MKKKNITKSLKLSKSSIASLADKEIKAIKGGASAVPHLCPTFIPILCLVTYRSCTFTETFRTCPV
ncbi:class I lanthipeptide [Kordia aestuariivivens]|uniref:class I lanthipeptide n=1 Tax=Kordia aestuariivivens TaxID=2759037 RepID=UPI0021D159C1|nr:class I lanthipeptide [Kordia aestuariivivens]